MDYVKELASLIKKKDAKVSYSKIISIDEDGAINVDDSSIIEL